MLQSLCGAAGLVVLGHGTERLRSTQLCKTEAPRYKTYLGHLTEQESRNIEFNVGGNEIKRVY